MEATTLEVSIALDSYLNAAVLHFAGLQLYLHVSMFIMAELWLSDPWAPPCIWHINPETQLKNILSPNINVCSCSQEHW